MMGGGFGYGMMGFGMLFVGLFWLLLIVGVVALVVWAVRSGPTRATASQDNALEILRIRYAKGELTKEQFDAMRRDLIG